jgi:hypothetical protein
MATNQPRAATGFFSLLVHPDGQIRELQRQYRVQHALPARAMLLVFIIREKLNLPLIFPFAGYFIGVKAAMLQSSR